MGGYHPTFLPDEAAAACRRGRDRRRRRRLGSSCSPTSPPDSSSRAIPAATQRRAHGLPARAMHLQQASATRRSSWPSTDAAAASRATSARSMPSTARTLRVRPVDGLVAEIGGLPQADSSCSSSTTTCLAESPTLQALLDALEPLGRRWSCQITIDVARDERLLDRMARAGCRFVLIGFESLNPASLRQMGKHWNRVSGPYRRRRPMRSIAARHRYLRHVRVRLRRRHVRHASTAHARVRARGARSRSPTSTR